MPYINIYLEDSAYGGPEEGGWYYTRGDTIKSIPMTTMRQAKRGLRIAERLVEKMNEGRPPISSVLSQGRYAARIERKQAADYPRFRPHYE